MVNFYLEKQKFNNRWVKGLLYFVLISSFFISILVYFKKMHTIIAFTPFFFVGLLFILFKKMVLILAVDNENISYQYIPFHSKMRSINKKDILSVSVDNYNPVSDYGGWGIRFGSKGKAYTMNGSFGIKLNLTGNKKLLIGTMKPKEVYSILKEKDYNPASNIF